MSKRKRKRSFFDLFDFDEERLFSGTEPAEGGSGYSISVTYDSNGKPVVQVETHGDVDEAKLRRDIEQRYPGAKIEGLEKKPLIRVVEDERDEKEEKRKKRKNKVKTEKKSS